MRQVFQLFSHHKLIACWVLLFFLSAVLRIYIPTSIAPELLIVCLFIYRVIKPLPRGQEIISKNAIIIGAFYFVYFILAASFTYFGDDGSGFFNENYRLLTFLLITFLLGSARVDYFSFARICLWCCRLHIFFTVFELAYLTIISFGDFYGVPLVGKAMPEFEDGSGYLLENDNLISFGFRPFGLMLQPQKTGFVFVLGAVLEYIIACIENRKPSLIWNIAFVVISIFQGAKTAFLMLFVIEAAIYFDFFPAKKKCIGRTAFFASVVAAVLYIIINSITLTEVGNDTNARVLDDIYGYFSYGPFALLFGIGTPVSKDMLAHGFSCECYLVRIFCNWGIPLTLLLFYFLSKKLLTKDCKINYILCVAFFGMVYHYCVINVYFIALAFSSAICLALYYDKSRNILNC